MRQKGGKAHLSGPKGGNSEVMRNFDGSHEGDGRLAATERRLNMESHKDLRALAVFAQRPDSLSKTHFGSLSSPIHPQQKLISILHRSSNVSPRLLQKTMRIIE